VLVSGRVEIERQVLFSKLDYCQYLLSSQKNYTLTNLADHLNFFSHDTINRYLRGEKLTPRLLWDNVKHLIQLDEDASIIFDDTVIDKNSSSCIELVRRQYSGTEHRVIRGIGLISCVYVNVKTGQFWVIDYRIYDPDGDGKNKLDHVADMLNNLVYSKQLPFVRILMDSWYAAQKLMAFIEKLGKTYYCPLKRNRLVDDSGGVEKYKQIEQLSWSTEEHQHGKLIKIKNFPKEKKVKLSCSSFKPYCQELQNPCSATILVATDTQFKCVTAYSGLLSLPIERTILLLMIVLKTQRMRFKK
jgi:hypothetical protein